MYEDNELSVYDVSKAQEEKRGAQYLDHLRDINVHRKSAAAYRGHLTCRVTFSLKIRVKSFLVLRDGKGKITTETPVLPSQS